MNFIENLFKALELLSIEMLFFNWWTTLVNALVFSALIFFLMYVVFKGFFKNRKIQNKSISVDRLVNHELKWAIPSLTVGAIFVITATELAVAAGIAWEGPVSPWLVVGEFALYFFLFDFYFYCVHRLLHADFLFKKVHRVHHVSTNPNPVSGFSFHPLETMITGIFAPALFYIAEPHVYSVAAITAYGGLSTFAVHCGHEFFPRWWYHNPLSRWYITPMFHDQHHKYFKSNYGGFTTIWDRVFKTMRPEFELDFDSHKAYLDKMQRQSAHAQALLKESAQIEAQKTASILRVYSESL